MRRYLLALVIPLAVTGCGDGGLEKFPVAKVKGKVLCDGKPVPDVRVAFGPKGQNAGHESGKPGYGFANEDGEFELSSYGNNDGAVIGKHDVVVLSPNPDDHPNFNCNCETSGKKILMEVEVTKDGDNEFTINLPVKADRNKSNFNQKELADVKAAEEQAGNSDTTE